MVDTLTPERRSWNMSRVRGKDTKPELLVRSMLHRMGYRFTVNGPKNRRLPGKPDIVLPRHNAVIFVHGCYWHRHKGCRLATMPSTNTAFWTEKFRRNVQRDGINQRALKRLGWNISVVWTCHLRNPERIKSKLERFLVGCN
jgi:DNA mismatch endonuclease (patch repair protein)